MAKPEMLSATSASRSGTGRTDEAHEEPEPTRASPDDQAARCAAAVPADFCAPPRSWSWKSEASMTASTHKLLELLCAVGALD
jgi:hypothetical protein